MSDSPEMPWSDDPNAPQIPYWLYFAEKAIFAGIFVGAILFGITVVLFFQCVGALLNPVNRTRGSVKWGLVVHTAAMFSLFAIPVAAHLSLQAISYIDNRRFPGDDVYPPGPVGYQYFTDFEAVNAFSRVMFPLNQWLADGLLLYRCYVIYSMSNWVIAFPSLMYITSVAMGILFIYESMQPVYITEGDYIGVNVTISYYSISLSLNVLLTLMIVIRLALYSRNIRNAMGTAAGVGGVYKAVVVTLVESSALYAVAYLVYIGPWAANSYLGLVFSPVLGGVQVIAPFLITLRVAKRRALTSAMIASGGIGSMKFKSQGRSTNGDETVPDGNLVSSVETNGETAGWPGVGTENTIEEVPLK